MNSNRQKYLFFFAYLIFSLAASFAHPVTPTIFNDLGLSSYMFGVALSAMQTMNFLFSPFWGKLNDYISSKYLLFAGTVGYAVGQYFFSIGQSELQIILARMFAGVFVGSVFVNVLNYTIQISKDDIERGNNLAIVATISSIFGAFGYLVGGFIGEISVKLTIYIQIVFLILSGVLFLIFTKSDETLENKKIEFKPLIKDANPFSAFIISREFMNKVLFIIFTVCVLQNLGMTIFDQTFNYFLKDQFNLSSSYNGTIKGIMGIITLVSNITITRWLIRKTNINKSIIYIFSICVINMLIVIIFDTPIIFIGSNVLFYGFSAVSMPLHQNIVGEKAKDNPKYRNSIIGFYNSMKSLGGIIGSLFAGILYAKSPKLPFIFGFIAFIFVTILSYIYYKKYGNKKALQGG